jgi:hypothetical protein
LHATSLIRTIDRVETPSVSRWTIAANQAITGSRRSLGRRLAGLGRIIEGELVMTEDRHESSLELTIAVEDLPFPNATTLHYRGASLLTTRDGVWLLNGTLTAGGVSRPLRSIVRYQGVYSRRDSAAAWLTLHARVDLSDFGVRRAVSGRFLDLMAELNADAPVARAPMLRRISEVSR